MKSLKLKKEILGENHLELAVIYNRYLNIFLIKPKSFFHLYI